ncbi:response regulator transcription factor [Exilibacterium tricleocarpae]|uniref:Response regulator transcription factor n=1 Tax=Exilibacterium tricleocarpae TaxID=2591008 RepID=A0A545SYB0_9GAMM|nr:response regulator transcription factor [Exilibacterium tricleocarpae]TQV69954.1 response regulator transcription factor [Exilibacterium tricleocarpae]
MELSAVFWNNHLTIGLEELLPQDLAHSIAVFEAKTFADVLACLERNARINMVITALKPTDIQALCEIQQLQQNYPTLTLVAIFDGMSQASAKAGARLLLKPIESSGGTEEATEEAASITTEGQTDSTEVRGTFKLTSRQRDVLALLVRGKSNKEIARALALSEGTVKIHCMAIFREMGVTNRTQAAIRGEEVLGCE